MNCRNTIFGSVFAFALCAGTIVSALAADPYPEPLSNRGEIRAAKATIESIDIWNLPLEDFPLLAKFKGLKRIRLVSEEGTLTTDQKLKALADVGFTNLTYIDLNNCQLVTDNGIEALSRIQSLKELTLEGTRITDTACDLMCSKMSLTVANIANCPSVTLEGIAELGRSNTLHLFQFSSDKLTQPEVLKLIESFNSIKWCEIVDLQGKLDANIFKAKGKEKNIHISVRRTGALQDMKLLKP